MCAAGIFITVRWLSKTPLIPNNKPKAAPHSPTQAWTRRSHLSQGSLLGCRINVSESIFPVFAIIYPCLFLLVNAVVLVKNVITESAESGLAVL
jgi:hypothetical protein